jgi:hypothetical protein
MYAHADYGVSKDCKNPDSFGEICVKCNQCGRWKKLAKKLRKKKDGK